MAMIGTRMARGWQWQWEAVVRSGAVRMVQSKSEMHVGGSVNCSPQGSGLGFKGEKSTFVSEKCDTGDTRGRGCQKRELGHGLQAQSLEGASLSPACCCSGLTQWSHEAPTEPGPTASWSYGAGEESDLGMDSESQGQRLIMEQTVPIMAGLRDL